MHGIKDKLCAPTLLMSAVIDKDGTKYDLQEGTSPKPIAINLNPGQCIFFPNDPNWPIAKMFFNNADVNFHEAITHLLKTHLNLEAFMVATLSLFPFNHPFSKLLFPHFNFTATINWAARATLTEPDGAFEQFFSLGHDGLFKVFCSNDLLVTFSL